MRLSSVVSFEDAPQNSKGMHIGLDGAGHESFSHVGLLANVFWVFRGTLLFEHLTFPS